MKKSENIELYRLMELVLCESYLKKMMRDQGNDLENMTSIFDEKSDWIVMKGRMHYNFIFTVEVSYHQDRKILTSTVANY